MSKQFNDLMTKITETFAELEAQLLQDTKEWAAARRLALAEWKASDEAKKCKHNAHEYYARAHAIMGGKTWYSMQQGRSIDDINAMITKMCKEAAAARIAKITKQLCDLEVQECQLVEAYADGATTVDGVYKMMTDKGQRVVTIKTVFAGGYNIQCGHLRVLCKVK